MLSRPKCTLKKKLIHIYSRRNLNWSEKLTEYYKRLCWTHPLASVDSCRFKCDSNSPIRVTGARKMFRCGLVLVIVTAYRFHRIVSILTERNSITESDLANKQNTTHEAESVQRGKYDRIKKNIYICLFIALQNGL